MPASMVLNVPNPNGQTPAAKKIFARVNELPFLNAKISSDTVNKTIAAIGQYSLSNIC